jgi:hypothetical protein
MYLSQSFPLPQASLACKRLNLVNLCVIPRDHNGTSLTRAASGPVARALHPSVSVYSTDDRQGGKMRLRSVAIVLVLGILQMAFMADRADAQEVQTSAPPIPTLPTLGDETDWLRARFASDISLTALPPLCDCVPRPKFDRDMGMASQLRTFSANPRQKVKLTLNSGRKLKGTITQVNAHNFTLKTKRGAPDMTIAYADLKSWPERPMTTGQTFAMIGLIILVVPLLPLILPFALLLIATGAD